MVNKGEPVLYYLKDGRSEDSPEKSSSQFFLELSCLQKEFVEKKWYT